MKSLIFSLCAAILTLRLLYKAWLGSTDFHVYWQAVRDWMSVTRSPYYFDASTRGFVFKYPPWVLPLFAPFGWVSFDVAKMLWALLSLFCLFYSIGRVVRLGVRSSVAFFTAVCLWFIWQDHFWSGQLTILLLASALWVMPLDRSETSNGEAVKLSLTGFLFTSKIFSVLTFAGNWRKFMNLRVLAGILSLCVLFTLLTWQGMRSLDRTVSIADVFRQFTLAAQSGGAELGAHVVRGQLNHGLTAAVLRFFQVDSTKSVYDAGVCLALTAILGIGWMVYSRRLSSIEFSSGWLALALITHPLAWDHSFVLAFPLCAFSLEKSLQTKVTRMAVLSFSGIACIGLIVPNVVGTDAVKPFEYVGIKSWGVILSAVMLVLSQRKVESSGLGPLARS